MLSSLKTQLKLNSQQRMFDCQSCRISLDRDQNAAKNLEKLGR
ncbi:zinc ribbon domain-containing protein [Nostoc sp.]